MGVSAYRAFVSRHHTRWSQREMDSASPSGVSVLGDYRSSILASRESVVGNSGVSHKGQDSRPDIEHSGRARGPTSLPHHSIITSSTDTQSLHQTCIRQQNLRIQKLECYNKHRTKRPLSCFAVHALEKSTRHRQCVKAQVNMLFDQTPCRFRNS